MHKNKKNPKCITIKMCFIYVNKGMGAQINFVVFKYFKICIWTDPYDFINVKNIRLVFLQMIKLPVWVIYK